VPDRHAVRGPDQGEVHAVRAELAPDLGVVEPAEDPAGRPREPSGALAFRPRPARGAYREIPDRDRSVFPQPRQRAAGPAVLQGGRWPALTGESEEFPAGRRVADGDGAVAAPRGQLRAIGTEGDPRKVSGTPASVSDGGRPAVGTGRGLLGDR